MKKIIVLILLPFLSNAQKADSTKFIQKINVGLIVATVTTTTFRDSENPFVLGYNLLANTTIVTPKTFHSVLYGFGNNTIRTLNGYFLPKNWDVYALYAKSLSSNGQYGSIGFEKMLTAGDARIFLFTEIGSDLKGTSSLSFGVLMSFQNVFWKRK